MTRTCWWIALAALLVLGWTPCTGLAEDEALETEDLVSEEAPPELREPTPEELKKLEAALKAAKKGNARSLDALGEFKHEKLEKPLLKLLTNKKARVAIRAAELLEFRAHEKLLKKMWKGYVHRQNKHRYHVKGKILRAYGRLEQQLDKRQFGEIESDWRQMHDNKPSESLAKAVVDYAWYIEHSKDKRLCKRLALALDEPMATNPNSPANPPREWWEARWKLWKNSKAAVVAALKSLTGQEFDKTKEARKWFEKNEKEFGFKW